MTCIRVWTEGRDLHGRYETEDGNLTWGGGTLAEKVREIKHVASGLPEYDPEVDYRIIVHESGFAQEDSGG